MHRFGGMMEFAKDLVSDIGCAAADLAKLLGSNTADAARFVGRNTADGARFVGRNTADAARFVGEGTVDLAKKVGPKRGIIGLVLIGGAVVGGVYLVRYLRERAAAAEDEDNAGLEGIKNKRVKNAA